MAKPTRIKEPAPTGACDRKACKEPGCWWVYTLMKSRSGNTIKRTLGLFCLECAWERTGEKTSSNMME